MAHTTIPTLRGLQARTAPTSPLGQPPDLRTSVAYDGIDRNTVQVGGEVDTATVDQLRATLDVTIAKGARQLIVDLRGVSFLGSEGLGCLVHASRRAEAAGGHLYTIATQRVVVRPIEVTGFARALRLRDDPAAVPPPFADS
jgi:anti-sigma B factor antagonist